MNDYYGWGWSASKLKLYFWITLIACVVMRLLHATGIVTLQRGNETHKVELEKQTRAKIH